jgi:hypothetical protein
MSATTTPEAVAALRRRYEFSGDARHWLAWRDAYLRLAPEQRTEAVWPRLRPAAAPTTPNAEHPEG